MSGPPGPPPNRDALLAIARRLFEEGRIVFAPHFAQRSEERSLPCSRLDPVFESARIAEGPVWSERHACWRLTLEGEHPDALELIRIVVAIDLEVEIGHFVTVC